MMMMLANTSQWDPEDWKCDAQSRRDLFASEKKKSVHENPNQSPTTNLYCKFPFIISKNGRLKLFQKIIGFSGGGFAEA